MAWVVHDAWDPTAHARTAHATDEEAYRAACFLLRERLSTEVHHAVESLYEAMIESSEVQNMASEAAFYEERLDKLNDRLKYYDAEHPHRDPRSWKQMYWRIHDEWKERTFEGGAREAITVEHAGCAEVGAKRAREQIIQDTLESLGHSREKMQEQMREERVTNVLDAIYNDPTPGENVVVPKDSWKLIMEQTKVCRDTVAQNRQGEAKDAVEDLLELVLEVDKTVRASN